MEIMQLSSNEERTREMGWRNCRPWEIHCSFTYKL